MMSLPSSHQRRLRTTNGLERLNKEIKRRTRVATLFPNEASLLRLATAVVMEISEDWETGRTYIKLEDGGGAGEFAERTLLHLSRRGPAVMTGDMLPTRNPEGPKEKRHGALESLLERCLGPPDTPVRLGRTATLVLWPGACEGPRHLGSCDMSLQEYAARIARLCDGTRAAELGRPFSTGVSWTSAMRLIDAGNPGRTSTRCTHWPSSGACSARPTGWPRCRPVRG